jgi:hypothetical protein
MDWATLGKQVIGAGAPVIGGLFGGPLGAQIGSIVGTALGVPPTPEAIGGIVQSNPGALQQLEASRSAEWATYMAAAQAAQSALAMKELDRSFFYAGWRPGMSWLLMGLWLLNCFITPFANAAWGAAIPLIPWEHLLGFSGLWLTIYGGGHTLKSILAR